MPRTRIVCTLGPATSSEEKIRALVRNGMSVARLNFSHGTLDDQFRRAELVHHVTAEEKANVALLGDLQGPKIRVGEIKGDVMMLREGEPAVFRLSSTASDAEIPLDYPFLADVLKPGAHLLLDDGNLRVEVDRVMPLSIETRVVNGGELRSHKGVNLPDTDLPIPCLTEKDRADAKWAIDHGLDYLALSFVRRPQDVIELRNLLRAHDAVIPIIAKIEKREAVNAIDEILQETYGVMVARGDMGVEMPAEQVPIYQKQIIRKANALGKPVITATQMLESMIHNPSPTRAEASDVANAILDGSDAVMLSAETAVGEHPIQAVQAMARIANFTEQNLHSFISRAPEQKSDHMSITDSIGWNTVDVAQQVDAKLIITLTASGTTARMVARHRPELPILAVTTHENVCRRLALVWGVETALIKEDSKTDHAVQAALRAARESRLVKPGDRVVVTAGVPTGIAGHTNMIQVREI